MAALDAADWSLRPAALAELRIVVDQGAALPGMTLALANHTDGWAPLCRAWRALAPHPNIVEILEERPATLRYAAIDWEARPDPKHALANAIAVARVFAHVVDRVDRADWVWFQAPRIWFDLRGEVRVWWEPVHPMAPEIAPEAKSEWLAPTEKLLVYALGRALIQVGFEQTDKGHAVVARCTARAILRPRTIGDVLRTLETYLRTGLPERDRAWDAFECGVGWLAVDRFPDARVCFEQALKLEPRSPWIAAGLERATVAVGDADLDKARRLEADHWWQDAIDEYRRCRPIMSGLDYHLSIARCAIGLNRMTEATVFASRASVADPSSLDAYRLVIEAGLADGRVAEVTAAVEELASRGPSVSIDAIAHATEAFASRSVTRALPSCVRALGVAFAASDVRASAPIVERVIRKLPANADAFDLCRQLRTLAPEHGARAVTHLVRHVDVHHTGVHWLSELVLSLPAEQAVFAWLELVERLEPRRTKQGPAQARDVFAALITLPAEQATRPLIALIRRVSVSDALAMCERVHLISPARSSELFSEAAETAFQAGELAAALQIADSMIERFPASGLGHYRRGRCLFNLGRLVEARAALDRAQVIEPALVDAMILRREVDRALTKVKDVVGSAFPQQLAIPAHLPEVRAAMARGSIPDAVSWLESHPLDGSARLLLGNLLIGQERYTDAMRAFEQVAGELVHAANVGRARALAAVGRGEEALRLLDRVVAEDPESTDAMVVRAKVVALLR